MTPSDHAKCQTGRLQSNYFRAFVCRSKKPKGWTRLLNCGYKCAQPKNKRAGFDNCFQVRTNSPLDSFHTHWVLII